MKRSGVLLLALGIFASGVAFAQAQVKLVFSTVSVPGDAHTQALYTFKDELEKVSGGKMSLDVYHSGQLFGQASDNDATVQGKLDMSYFSAQWLAQHVPSAAMLGAAFTFQSYEQMTRTLNGPVGQKIFEQAIAKLGVRPLGAYYLGTRQLNLIEKVGPVTKPEQMKGVKFRVPNAPAWIAMGRALGANPTPMAFGEVYMGLKTGVVDGQDNPLPTDKNAKFYEVTKYIVLTNHVVDSVWPSINERKWKTLTAQQQQWLTTASDKARAFCDKTNLDNEASILSFFRQQGLTVIENPDRAAFAAFAKNYYRNEAKDFTKDWDWNLYDEIQKVK